MSNDRPDLNEDARTLLEDLRENVPRTDLIDIALEIVDAEMLSNGEAAERIGYTEAGFRSFASRGQTPPVHAYLKGTPLYDRELFELWEANRRHGRPNPYSAKTLAREAERQSQ